MTDTADRRALAALAPAPGGLLSPALRRDLADLNAQYLAFGLTPGLDADPWFAWAEPVRTCLQRAGAATLERLAAVPFALFELALPTRSPEPGGVADGRPAGRGGTLQGRCESFAHQAAYLAWRLIERDALAARVVLALSEETQSRLTECRPSQFAELVSSAETIRPRWRFHARFWALLVGAADRESPTALAWAQCIGLCLVGAEEVPAPRTARRRTRG